MQRCSFGEGIAFITLIVSAGAMDSESLIVPGIGCIASALILMAMGKKKEPAGTGSIQNQ